MNQPIRFRCATVMKESRVMVAKVFEEESFSPSLPSEPSRETVTP